MGRERAEGLAGPEDGYTGYEVVDRDGVGIGKVDDLFVDEADRPEYIGVKMGFFGTKSTLIPTEIARVDEEGKIVVVAAEKSYVKDGPSFGDDPEITPEFEDEVHRYYGLEGPKTTEERGAYGAYYAEQEQPYKARKEREHPRDEDELRVQRTEEELRAGTREREVGRVNVRKRVRTDRERIEVPTRREEVSVERVPVNEEASGAQIGGDEVSVPVTEEEVVVEKRPVVKEEVRIRKDVVEDTEVVEEDVRREEVDVEDATRGDG